MKLYEYVFYVSPTSKGRVIVAADNVAEALKQVKKDYGYLVPFMSSPIVHSGGIIQYVND